MKQQMKITRTETGNALLELVLFIPVLLLMLTAGLEVALAYAERSAITNALRAGLNGPRSSWGTERQAEAGSTGFDDGMSQSFDGRPGIELLNRAAGSIEYDLLRTRGRNLSPGSDPYLIRTALVESTFDPETGRLLNCRIVDAVERGQAGFRPPESDIGAPYIDAEDYINGACSADVNIAPVVPAKAFVVPLDGAAVQILHHGRIFQIYGEVNAVVRGLNRQLARTILNRSFTVREQAMVLLRPPGGR